MNRLLFRLAIVAAVSYQLFARWVPDSGDVILKSSMCVMLAVLAWRCTHPLLSVALLFAAIGDALLAIDGAKLFVYALASFFMTHLLYAAIFVRVSRDAPVEMNGWRRAGMFVAAIFAGAYSIVLWPRLGALSMPVLFYMTAIVTMTVLSFRVRPLLVPIGALLFMVSDSIIALGKFLWPASWLGAIVWITYAAAQLLIAYGLLRPLEDRSRS